MARFEQLVDLRPPAPRDAKGEHEHDPDRGRIAGSWSVLLDVFGPFASRRLPTQRLCRCRIRCLAELFRGMVLPGSGGFVETSKLRLANVG